MEAFIDDGYTVTGGINERPRLHPKMEFTFRPLAGNEVRELYARASREGEEPVFKAIIDRVSAWSFDRPLTADNLRKLHPVLFERVWNALTGSQPVDYIVTAEGQEPPTPPEEDQKN